MKKLYLEQQRNPRAINPTDLATSHVWVVRRVVGATEPRVYDVLDRATVHGYIANDDWQVEVK